MVRSEADALLGVSAATSSRILKRMAGSGLIVKAGNGRETRYRRK